MDILQLILERQWRLPMENKTNKSSTEFHAVEFMRQVRSELSEQFLQDKKKYFEYLKRSMEDFKVRQKKNKK